MLTGISEQRLLDLTFNHNLGEINKEEKPFNKMAYKNRIQTKYGAIFPNRDLGYFYATFYSSYDYESFGFISKEFESYFHKKWDGRK